MSYNIGVIIAIWAPIVLVSEVELQECMMTTFKIIVPIATHHDLL